jgi:hypothetical protein
MIFLSQAKSGAVTPFAVALCIARAIVASCVRATERRERPSGLVAERPGFAARCWGFA